MLDYHQAAVTLFPKASMRNKLEVRLAAATCPEVLYYEVYIRSQHARHLMFNLRLAKILWSQPDTIMFWRKSVGVNSVSPKHRPETVRGPSGCRYMPASTLLRRVYKGVTPPSLNVPSSARWNPLKPSQKIMFWRDFILALGCLFSNSKRANRLPKRQGVCTRGTCEAYWLITAELQLNRNINCLLCVANTH